MRDGNSFPLVCVCFQVILAYESIVLCKCSGKYIDIYFSLKITYLSVYWMKLLQEYKYFLTSIFMNLYRQYIYIYIYWHT